MTVAVRLDSAAAHFRFIAIDRETRARDLESFACGLAFAAAGLPFSSARCGIPAAGRRFTAVVLPWGA